MGLRLPEVEYDDIAFDEGGTFGLRCNIAVPPDGDDMNNEQKIEYTVTRTRIKLYTMERIDDYLGLDYRKMLTVGWTEKREIAVSFLNSMRALLNVWIEEW